MNALVTKLPPTKADGVIESVIAETHRLALRLQSVGQRMLPFRLSFDVPVLETDRLYVPHGGTVYEAAPRSAAEVVRLSTRSTAGVALLYRGQSVDGQPLAMAVTFDGRYLNVPVVQGAPEPRSVQHVQEAPPALPTAPTFQEVETALVEARRTFDKADAGLKAAQVDLTRAADDCDAIDELQERRDELTKARLDLLANAYAADREDDTSSVDADLMRVGAEIGAAQDRANAAAVVRPSLVRRVDRAEAAHAEAKRHLGEARSRWAGARQKEALAEFHARLEALGEPLAVIMALDDIRVANGWHLSAADQILNNLKGAFFGPYALEPRPSWIAVGGAQRPALSTARDIVGAEMARVEAGDGA